MKQKTNKKTINKYQKHKKSKTKVIKKTIPKLNKNQNKKYTKQ